MYRFLEASSTRPAANGLHRRGVALGVPVVVTLVMFIAGAQTGGSMEDPGFLPLVRFLSLLVLAMGLFTCLVISVRCVYSHVRWAMGLVASLCMGLGAGFLWSAFAFGLGFLFLMAGLVITLLLMLREFDRRGKRVQR